MIAVFVLLVGIFLVCYPFVSNVLNQLEQDKVSVNQQQVVEQLEPEDLSAQKQAPLDYNARLFAGSVPHDGQPRRTRFRGKKVSLRRLRGNVSQVHQAP